MNELNMIFFTIINVYLLARSIKCIKRQTRPTILILTQFDYLNLLKQTFRVNQNLSNVRLRQEILHLHR